MDKSGGLLERAELLLREGRREEARPFLVEFIRANPSSARGWWLLSAAVTDAHQQIDCVKRVLNIAPDYAPARERLEKLQSRLAVGPSAGFAASKPNPSASPAEALLHPPRPARKAPAPSPKVDWVVLASLLTVFCICMTAGGMWMFLYASQEPAEAASQDETAATPIPPSKIGPTVGKYAPDFTLQNVGTWNKESLSGYRGRPVVIMFWATWCGFCKQEMPSLQRVYTAYQGAGLVVLAVDVGESASVARNFKDAHNLTFPVLNDDREAAARAYRITGYPTNIFVDSTGKVFAVAEGMLTYAQLDSKARALLDAGR